MATAKKVGTPIEGEYDSYTAEQLATLEEMKDRSFALGIAQKKFVNHIVWPDGSITKGTDELGKGATAKLKKLLGGDLEDPDILRAADFAARRVKEIKEHIAANRFVFFVDEEGNPTVYFQCATPDHPELPAKATAEDKDLHEEVKARMGGIIQHAHNKAAERRAAAKVGVIK